MDRIYPVLRTGSIIWKHPNGKYFATDVLTFGGNSGSPIISVNEITNEWRIYGVHYRHEYTNDSQNMQFAKAVYAFEILEIIENIKWYK